MDRNHLLIGIAVVSIVAVGVLILTQGSSWQFLDKIKSFGGVSKDKLAKKAIDYINKNILSGQTATLNNTSEESGLVKINFNIADRKFDSYITKDGNLLFPEAIKLGGNATINNQPNQNTNTQPSAQQVQQAGNSLTKTDKPLVEAYVVSKCPFGLQMQRVLSDVIRNAPSLAQNIKVRYIGSISNGTVIAMHGDAEAQENLRQICIRDEQNNKYWDYVSCHIKAGDVNGCLSSAGVDTNKLNGCVSDKNRGLVYAKEDFDLSTKYGVQGSPTLVESGNNVSEFSFGGRTSEALKSIVCGSYKTQPSICSKTLNTTEAATSFSPTYAGAGGSGNSGNNGANCAPAS